MLPGFGGDFGVIFQPVQLAAQQPERLRLQGMGVLQAGDVGFRHGGIRRL